jgi:hypothetical protein
LLIGQKLAFWAPSAYARGVGRVMTLVETRRGGGHGSRGIPAKQR